MARRFGDKRLQWRFGLRVKEWPGDRDLGAILLQDRRASSWPKFDHGHHIGSAAAERHLASRSGVAPPGYLAIGSHEPAMCAVLHQGYRRRIPCAGSLALHRQPRGVLRSQTHQKEDSRQRIEETTPVAQAIPCSHDGPLASECSSYLSGRRWGSPDLLRDSCSKSSTPCWRGRSRVGTLMVYDTRSVGDAIIVAANGDEHGRCIARGFAVTPQRPRVYARTDGDPGR